MKACPICAAEAPLLYTLHDDRYGFPGSFPYHRCRSCGLVFQASTMTTDELTRLYSEYYPRSSLRVEAWTPYQFQPGFRAWLQGYSSAYMRVPPNVRVLDIGCGFGGALGYHRLRGCDAHGTEMDSNALRVAEAYGLDIRLGAFNPEDWDGEQFDYVTLDQVLEHNYDALPLLQDIRRVLKPGGRLIFTTPNASGWAAEAFGRRWIHWHPPYHVRLHTRRSLTQLLKQAGFTLDRLDTVTSAAWLQYQLIHMATYPAEGMKSSFWDPRASESKSFAHKVVSKLSTLLYKSLAIPLVTHIFDALGAGDNFVGEATP